MNNSIRLLITWNKKKNDLLAENMNLKQELRNARINAEIVKNNDSPEVTNVDIMRRLARLEKLVYGVSKADRTSYNKDNYNQDDNSNE